MMGKKKASIVRTFSAREVGDGLVAFAILIAFFAVAGRTLFPERWVLQVCVELFPVSVLLYLGVSFMREARFARE